MFNENNIVHIALLHIWDLILANLLFILCSIPLITIGPSLTALHHCTLRIVKGNNHGVVKTFFRAFKENFRQSIIVWICSVIAFGIVILNIRFLKDQGTSFAIILRYASWMVLVILIIFTLYIYPVIAAFSGTLKQLIKNAFLFGFMHFVHTFIMANVWFLPLFITYVDIKLQPLYVFCWFFFLFSTLAYINSFMLYKDFKPYLGTDDIEEIKAVFYEDHSTNYLP